MDSNQFCRKKIVSLVDEKLRKVENFHMLISDQYYNTLEREIYYTERSAVISDINMIQIHHGIMKQGEIFPQKCILQIGLNKFSERGVKYSTNEIDQLHK